VRGRKQKISDDSYQKKNRAELEGYSGVQTYIGITENNITNFNESEYGLLEQILSPTNLNLAFKKVKSNEGSGGVDKMEVESLKDYLVENKEMIKMSILGGKYRPNPVRRVEIPKDINKKEVVRYPNGS
jgi:RNA-directed DNA polymerase